MKFEHVSGMEGLLYTAWGELKSDIVYDDFYILKNKCWWVCKSVQCIYTAPYSLYNIISEVRDRLYKDGTTTFEIYKLTVMVLDMLNYSPRFNPTGEHHIKFDNKIFNRWVECNENRY